MTPLRVQCEIVSPLLYYRDGLNLDGPLQYGAYCEWRLAGGDPDTLPPLGGPIAHDFDMHVERWEFGDVWGWRTSDVVADWSFAQPVPFRGPTPHDKMKRYAREGSVNIASGDYKGSDLRFEAWTPTGPLTWYVYGERDGVARLLEHVTYLGKKHNLGCGKVAAALDGTPQWSVEEIDHDYSIRLPDGRLARRMPRGFCDGRPGHGPIRAPNWHRARWVDSVESETRW